MYTFYIQMCTYTEIPIPLTNLDKLYDVIALYIMFPAIKSYQRFLEDDCGPPNIWLSLVHI